MVIGRNVKLNELDLRMTLPFLNAIVFYLGLGNIKRNEARLFTLPAFEPEIITVLNWNSDNVTICEYRMKESFWKHAHRKTTILDEQFEVIQSTVGNDIADLSKLKEAIVEQRKTDCSPLQLDGVDHYVQYYFDHEPEVLWIPSPAENNNIESGVAKWFSKLQPQLHKGESMEREIIREIRKRQQQEQEMPATKIIVSISPVHFAEFRKKITTEGWNQNINGYTVRKDSPHYSGDEYHAHIELPGGKEIAWTVSGKRKHRDKFPVRIPIAAKNLIAQVLKVPLTKLESYLAYDEVEKAEVCLITLADDNQIRG